MRITVSKILNKTDLAKSGSHGGLVVTKSDQQVLKEFFETPGKDQKFKDRSDEEEFAIHYQNYTSNGTTPNDRITPIGKYASKHGLQAGDILILEKTDNAGRKNYYIEYARKMNSILFAGKSRKTVDILNYEQFVSVLETNIKDGTVKLLSDSEFEMKARYLGVDGSLKIVQQNDDYELYFNGVPISENKKYFELDTSVNPFTLKKTETWRIGIDAEKEVVQVNLEADRELVSDVADIEPEDSILGYIPQPEQKVPKKEYKGKKIPVRSKERAKNALARAEYKCEIGNHETFLRKKSLLPYTEPHHLIPLQYDDQFEYSLDVEANIISLCSNCHNRIHYGADIEQMIRRLWDQRKNELEAAGLLEMKNGMELTIDILLSFYGIE